jgi:type 1 glutamine amidotransferase
MMRSACIAISAVVSLAAAMAPVLAQRPARTVRVLVVTGGHDFDPDGFATLWQTMKGMEVRQVAHPDAHAWFSPQRAQDFDVLVFYDMHQDISEEARKDLTALLKRGKGLVVLHHALANYQSWGEYVKIAGGRFRLAETDRDGVKRPASTWKDDVAFRVRVVDPRHPVTRGLKDFDIVDETYGDLDVLPTAKPLLTTDEPTSNRVIAWAHEYGRSRVVTIQSGHGPSAWQNPAFRQLLKQAVNWVAGSSRQ